MKKIYYEYWVNLISPILLKEKKKKGLPFFQLWIFNAYANGLNISMLYLIFRKMFSLPADVIHWQLLDRLGLEGINAMLDNGFFIFLLIHYFLVFHKKRYEQLILQYRKDDYEIRDSKKAYFFFLAYLSASPLFAVIIASFQDYIPVLVK